MACDQATSANSAIVSALTGPLKVQGDAGMIEQRPIGELIQAANYLNGLCAANTRRMGLRFRRLIPDGAVHSHLRWPRWGAGGGDW